MPGLYKIFDEILVNAADNKQRDPSMDTIRIDIDPARNTIRVWNNGAPHPLHAMAAAAAPVTLLFSHASTSSRRQAAAFP